MFALEIDNCLANEYVFVLDIDHGYSKQIGLTMVAPDARWNADKIDLMLSKK